MFLLFDQITMQFNWNAFTKTDPKKHKKLPHRAKLYVSLLISNPQKPHHSERGNSDNDVKIVLISFSLVLLQSRRSHTNRMKKSLVSNFWSSRQKAPRKKKHDNFTPAWLSQQRGSFIIATDCFWSAAIFGEAHFGWTNF